MDWPLQYLQWVLSPHPPGQKAIKSRWRFKIKDGTIEIFKARFVAQGFSQVFGSDYEESFAPTAKLCTLRNCFALAVSGTTFVVQFDVRSALLNVNLSDDIYIEQPRGFAPARANGEKLYCKLQKCLFGLKQAGWGRNKTITLWILKKELVQPAEDHCLYRCDESNGSYVFIIGTTFWVDDILYFSNNDKMLHDFKAKLSNAFGIDDRW